MSSSILPLPPTDLLVGASLFIDFDGTLVELVDRPDQVVVDAPLRDLLGRIGAALPGRVAIVSGRSIEQIDNFLGEIVNGMGVAGSHGVERRFPGGMVSIPTDLPGIAPAVKALADFAAEHPGTIIEHKRYGVALHYRLAPAVAEKAHAIVHGLAESLGFGVQTGKMMVELKIAGGDKGQALAAFLQEPSMADTRPWFIGDDLTDEAGFSAAKLAGGGGIFVGAPRDTAATYALPDVFAVRDWLAKAVQNLV